MKTFTASRVSDGNGLFPCKIIIQKGGVTVKVPGIFNNAERFIPFNNISEVSIDTPLIGYSTLKFYTTGVGVVKAHGFTKSEVKEIKQFIDNGGNEEKNTNSTVTESFSVKESSFSTESSYSDDYSDDYQDDYVPPKRKEVITYESEETQPKQPEAVKSQEPNPAMMLLQKRLQELEKKNELVEKREELAKEIVRGNAIVECLEAESKSNTDNQVYIHALLATVERYFEEFKNDILSEFGESMDNTNAEKVFSIIESLQNIRSQIQGNYHLGKWSDAEILSAYNELQVKANSDKDELGKLYRLYNDRDAYKFTMVSVKMDIYFTIFNSVHWTPRMQKIYEQNGGDDWSMPEIRDYFLV